MGNHKFPNIGNKELDLRSCADVLVVVSSQYIGALSEGLTGTSFPGLEIVEAAAGETIPEGMVKSASLAVIEVDPSDSHSVDRLEQLYKAGVTTPVIAAIPGASVALVRTLMRQGVADVVALPFTTDELLDTALNVLARRSTRKVADQKHTPMIAVVQSIGGCGATSIATHLTAELARQSRDESGAAIIDLDLQFGSVADFLAAKGRGSINDLLEAGERLDDDLVRSVARQADDGVAVIAAPDEILPLESIDTDKLLHVLEQARHNYSHVVLDLPANWTSWTLSAVMAADIVLLVVELSVTSLRQAKRRLDLLQSIGIPKDHIAIVVNRFEKRLFRTISLGDVEETLHHSVLASIALDDPAVNSAQNQGRLVSSVHRKSRFGQDIAQLAGELLAGPMGGSQ